MEQLELFPDYKYECPHRDPVPMKWEWADGYGRRKILDGLYCIHCQFENRWPKSDNWINPADIVRDEW